MVTEYRFQIKVLVSKMNIFAALTFIVNLQFRIIDAFIYELCSIFSLDNSCKDLVLF